MKKILLSLLIVAGVAGSIALGTSAYFTDEEQALGNTFTTGTIDIAVDGTNPWTRTAPYTFEDMKPSQVEYSNFEIENVGTNPANVWKKVDVVSTADGLISEPECVEGNGTWDNATKTCGGSYVAKNDIDTAITYDLSVELYDAAGVKQWNQVLYDMDKTIAQINGQSVSLGMIPAGWSMKVTESYHMLSETTNWAQGDVMNFNITLSAEQLKGVATLEDKSADWQVQGDTTPKGTLTYGVKDSTFTYTFTGVAPLASTNYSLIAYYEPFSSPSASGWPRTVEILGTTVSDGSGNVSIPSTPLTLTHDLLNMKVWLVPSSNLTGSTMSGFTQSAILFDTGLLDYYRSGI